MGACASDAATSASSGNVTGGSAGRLGGAALGKCKVGVTKVAAVTASTVPSTDKPKTKEDWEAKKAMMEKGMKSAVDDQAKAAAGGPLIPAKYADSATSGLSFEIKANESENNFVIDIKD